LAKQQPPDWELVKRLERHSAPAGQQEPNWELVKRLEQELGTLQARQRRQEHDRQVKEKMPMHLRLRTERLHRPSSRNWPTTRNPGLQPVGKPASRLERSGADCR
jgi:predicted molibdopterin-dependent oxidoreductase YjgC